MAGASLEAARSVRPVNVTPFSSALQPSCKHVHNYWLRYGLCNGHWLAADDLFLQLCLGVLP
jgi:hypothetical protein